MFTPISTLLTANLVDLHCPVCGECIGNISPHAEIMPCEHLLFVATDAGEFTYVTPRYKAITDRALAARREYQVEVFSYVVDHLEPDDLFFFSVEGIGFQHSYAFSFELDDDGPVKLDEEA